MLNKSFLGIIWNLLHEKTVALHETVGLELACNSGLNQLMHAAAEYINHICTLCMMYDDLLAGPVIVCIYMRQSL